jgi:hypothetical protein
MGDDTGVPAARRAKARQLRALSVVVLSVDILAGCGSAASGGSAPYRPSNASIPKCAHAGRAISLPKEFPHNFPLLAGTAITAKSTFGDLVVNGFVPSESFDSTVKDLTNTLSNAGWTAAEQDAEPPFEADSIDAGSGYYAQWKLRSIPGCSGAMTIRIEITKRT